MALNPFDDAVDQLGAAPTPPPAPPPQAPSPPKKNPYLDVVQEMQDERSTAAKANLKVGTRTTPDTAAEAARLSETLGIPLDVAIRNLDDARSRAQVQEAPVEQMMRDTPHLAEWLGQSAAHAAVVQDDLPHMGFLEFLTTQGPLQQYAQTRAQQGYADLRFNSMWRPLLPEEQRRMEELKQASHTLDPQTAWFRKVVAGAGAFAANQVPVIKYGAAGAATGAAVGAIGGIPGAIAGGTAMGGLGMLAGVGQSTFVQETVGAYDEFSDFKDEHLQPLDPAVAKAAAVLVGAINAPIEAGVQELLLRFIPGIKGLSVGGIRGLVKEALLRPTFRAALARFMGSYGKTMLAEVGQEDVQQLVEIGAGELAKVVSGQDIKRKTLGEVGTEIAATTVEAAATFAIGVGVGPSVTFFRQVGATAKESKTVERAPEAAEAFIDQANKDDPYYYLPIDTFKTFYESKGEDPQAKATELTGDPLAYQHALRTTEDLKITKGRYIARLAGTDDNAFFENELRRHEQEENGREFDARQKAEAAQAAAPAGESPLALPELRQHLAEQLKGIGMEAKGADATARWVEGTFGTMSRAAGEAPLETYQRYGIQMAREGFPLPVPPEAVSEPAVPPATAAPEAAPQTPAAAMEATIAAPTEAPAAPPVEAGVPRETAATAEGDKEGYRKAYDTFVAEGLGAKEPERETFGLTYQQAARIRQDVMVTRKPGTAVAMLASVFAKQQTEQEAAAAPVPANAPEAIAQGQLTGPKQEIGGYPSQEVVFTQGRIRGAISENRDGTFTARAFVGHRLAAEGVGQQREEAIADAKTKFDYEVEQERRRTARVPKPVTPQLPPAGGGTAYVLPSFASTPGQRTATIPPSGEAAPAAAPVAAGPPAEPGALAGGPAGPGASVSGEPAGRPGDARAADVAAEQPQPAGAVPEKPAEPSARPKRGTAPRQPRARPGAGTEGAGRPARASGGADPTSHVDTADVAVDGDVGKAEARAEQPRHFVIDDTGALTEGGWTAKLEDNLGAIRLLKDIEREGRVASDAEQQVLARYVGWGHTNLAPIVDPRAEALRTRDPRLQKARADLEALLTEAELRELGESTANAHYTFFDLPRAMWDAVGRMGFKAGIVLEPAVGTGHFFGTMPGTIVKSNKTQLWGIDKEPIAAGISRQLYQGANIQASPIQDANLPNDYFDLAISNVPFGKIAIFDPQFTSAEKKPLTTSIHNYYFGKALDVVRPGGLVAFVTSRYTMDARSDTVRAYLAERAQLLGAIRLPDTAFKKTAGTDVVTDVLFLRKLNVGETAKGTPAWVESVEHETLDVHTNAYFQAHPEHILGTENMTGKMARTQEPQYNVTGTATFEQMQEALRRALPADVYKPSKAAPRKLAKVIAPDVKQGTFQVDGGKLFLYDKGTLVPSDLTGENLARAKAFVPIRDAYQQTLDVMTARGSDEDLQKAQVALTAKYKFFVATFGSVNLRQNRKVIEQDPNGGRILALEHVDFVKEKKGRPAVVRVTGHADIFTKRTMEPPIEPASASTPADALSQSLAWRGGVDMPYMAALVNQPETDVIKALTSTIYQDPVTKAWYGKDEYLSGDVVTKLAQAQAAATTDARYIDNAAALEKVQPRRLNPDEFFAPFGATWVPVATYESFLREELKSSATVSLINTDTRVRFYVEGQGTHEFLPPGMRFDTWVSDALNGDLTPIKSKGPDGKEYVDQQATDTYRESLKQLRERWAEWWAANDEASDTLTNIYNGMFNREAAYVADGSHVIIPNANPAIKLRPWQKNVIWRAIQQGNTLIAHAVGAGKTYAMAAIAGEMKRLGTARKPMIMSPNHLVGQWHRAFLNLYPGARVLVPTDEDFDASRRKTLIAKIANNDWDAVIMAESQFLRVSVKLETLKAFIKTQEDQLLADGAEQMSMSTEDFSELVTGYGADEKAAKQAIGGRNTPRSVKDIARAILNLRARLQKRIDQSKKESPVTFEELGVDALLVDEAHLFKNLYFSTAKNNIAGLKGSDSDRAMDMFLKVGLVNKQSNNRNVIFATGTPISNTMSELYTMFRYLAQGTLDRLGMAGFDSWANGYAEATAEMEPKPGGGYKERTRLRNWSNLRELSAMFRRFADIVTKEDLVKSGAVTLPSVKRTTIALPPHPEMAAFMETLRARIDALATGKVDKKVDNHLLVTTHASLAAIDLRLVEPTAAYDPNGRIPTAAREIAKRYETLTPTLGTQIVFLDIGVPKKKAMPPLPASITGMAPTAAPAVELKDVDEDAEDAVAEAEAAADEEIKQIESTAKGMRDLYGDLRQELVKLGIPNNEIAYVQQAQNPYEQEKLYAAVNAGRVRVLLGSTTKGATGMNVQERLAAMHQLDVPWTPAAMEQRLGRMERQGNTNTDMNRMGSADTELLRYITERSFDEYRWGLLATKQGSISAVMKGDLNTLDDMDPSQLDMQTQQALASGDPRTLEMLNKEREVKSLVTRYNSFANRLNQARRGITSGKDLIDKFTEQQALYEAAVSAADAWEKAPTISITQEPGRFYGLDERAKPLTVDWATPEGRKRFQDEVERLLKAKPYIDQEEIATAGPWAVQLFRSSATIFEQEGNTVVSRERKSYSLAVTLPGKGTTPIGVTPLWEEGSDKFPDFRRSLDAYLKADRLRAIATGYAERIATTQADVKRNQEIVTKPFPQAELLKQREQELSELRTALGVERGVPKAAAEGKEFGQPAPTEPKRLAQIQFGIDPTTGLPRTLITLLRGANTTSALHEFLHLFLEVFGDLADTVRAKDPSTLTPEQQRFLDDYNQLLVELKVKSRAEIGEAEHERFVELGESYLEQGKAPSEELQPIFARFSAWFKGVWEAILRSGVEVSPAMHGIFDRMFASEVAIDQAIADAGIVPLFVDRVTAGMTEEGFERYRNVMEDANQAVRTELRTRLMRERQREQTAKWNAEKDAMRAVVETEMQAQPVYRALAAIRKGTNPDGSPLVEGQKPVPMKLAKADLSQYSADVMAKLRKYQLYTVEGGVHPDVVAQMFGYSSGDALVQALVAAPPYEKAVDAETERRMQAEHPSLIQNPAALAAEADALVNGEHRQEVVVAELKALTKGMRKAVIPNAARMNALAAARVADMPVRSLRPGQFLMAARRASERAFNLLATLQDREGAVQAKQQELYNLALYREATKAKAAAAAGAEWVREKDNPAGRQRLGQAGADYLDQWDGVLDRYEFKRVPLYILDRRAAMVKWIAAQEGMGLPVDLPPEIVNDARRKNWQDLTVAQLRGVIDGLKQLRHLANLKNRLLLGEKGRELKEASEALRLSLEEHSKGPRQKQYEVRLPQQMAARSASWWFASHRKLSFILNQFDGYKDGGLFWESLMRPINEAGDQETARYSQASETYALLYDEAFGGEERALFRQEETPGVPGSLSLMGRVMVALNWGNEGNRDRMRSDRHRQYSEAHIQAILGSLTAKQLAFVQGVWDWFDTYKPEMAAKQKRVFGIEPEWVEAAPFTVQSADGKTVQMRGGYFPIAYENWLSARSAGKLETTFAESIERSSYVASTTDRGHLEARAQHVEEPLRLDFGVISQHVQAVIHDLTHHEMLIDVTRLVGSRPVQDAIYAHYGDIVYDQMKGAIRDIAWGNAPAPHFFAPLNYLRQGVVIGGLAWNVGTFLVQPTQVINGAVEIGPKWVARGAIRWARNAALWENTAAWIQDRSLMMRNRGRTFIRENNELRNAVGLRHGKVEGWMRDTLAKLGVGPDNMPAIADSFFYLILRGQQVADNIVWLGAYEKFMADARNDENRAVALADQAVLNSQGGGQTKDLSSVERNAIAKLFTTFYSYQNLVYNQTGKIVGRTNFKSPQEIGRLAVDALLLLVIPSAVTYALHEAIGGNPEDKKHALWVKMLKHEMADLFGLMIGVRELAGIVEGYDYQGPAGTRYIATLARLAQQTAQGEPDAAFWRALNQTGGIILHYPATQVQRTTEGIHALLEGQTHNPLALVTGAPPKD